jgi:hypothetical protein
MIKFIPTNSLSGKAFAASAMMLALIAGCHNSDSSNSTSTDKSLAAKPFQVLRADHPPLSTLITMTGKIEIVDFNDNSRPILKKTKVLPNTLITVNTTGVSINAKPVTQDHLDRKHTFEIRFYPN